LRQEINFFNIAFGLSNHQYSMLAWVTDFGGHDLKQIVVSVGHAAWVFW
jgi:hypothetical protein